MLLQCPSPATTAHLVVCFRTVKNIYLAMSMNILYRSFPAGVIQIEKSIVSDLECLLIQIKGWMKLAKARCHFKVLVTVYRCLSVPDTPEYLKELLCHRTFERQTRLANQEYILEV